MICISHVYLSGYKIQKNEMYGAWNAYEKESFLQDFGGKTCEKETTWDT